MLNRTHKLVALTSALAATFVVSERIADAATMPGIDGTLGRPTSSNLTCIKSADESTGGNGGGSAKATCAADWIVGLPMINGGSKNVTVSVSVNGAPVACYVRTFNQVGQIASNVPLVFQFNNILTANVTLPNAGTAAVLCVMMPNSVLHSIVYDI